MSAVQLVPTQAEDLPHVFGEPLPCRIKALTVKRGDEVLGVGGLFFMQDNTVAAFVAQKAGAARKYPLAVCKAARRTIDEARAMGIRRIVATAEDDPAAGRWLAWLGFKPLDHSSGHLVWVWEE